MWDWSNTVFFYAIDFLPQGLFLRSLSGPILYYSEPYSTNKNFFKDFFCKYIYDILENPKVKDKVQTSELECSTLRFSFIWLLHHVLILKMLKLILFKYSDESVCYCNLKSWVLHFIVYPSIKKEINCLINKICKII